MSNSKSDQYIDKTQPSQISLNNFHNNRDGNSIPFSNQSSKSNSLEIKGL